MTGLTSRFVVLFCMKTNQFGVENEVRELCSVFHGHTSWKSLSPKKIILRGKKKEFQLEIKTKELIKSL